jgi:uncharacterized membrane protein
MGIEVALLAVAIGGTAFSVKQQREAAKEASSARKAQRLAANLSFLNTIDTLSETAFLASGRAADAQSRAGIGQAVAGLATTGLSRTGTGTGTGT